MSRWDARRDKILKREWFNGAFAQDIADAIGDGVTKNAVIGRAHRLGLPQRDKTTLHRSRRITLAPVAFSRVTPDDLVKIFVVDGVRDNNTHSDIGALHRSVLTVEDRECRWPIGDPKSRDFHFCGRAAVPGKSYCGAHCKIAFQAPDPRRHNVREEAKRKKEFAFSE